MTNDEADRKEQRLAIVLAQLQHVERQRREFAAERDRLISELLPHRGHGYGARLAERIGVTRGRVHQMAKAGRHSL